jgi:hypothetical protein
MRVPNLDWVPDLFADAVPAQDDPIIVIGRAPPAPGYGSHRLWPEMSNVWARHATAPALPASSTR